MRVRGQPIEAVDEIRRIGTRAREREVLARSAVEPSNALAAHRRRLTRLLSPEHAIEQLFELLPLGLVQRFECQRRHARLPIAHCATPSTRRVTLGPALPPSPDTAAANAASSSSRSLVSVGARAASATIAA